MVARGLSEQPQQKGKGGPSELAFREGWRSGRDYVCHRRSHPPGITVLMGAHEYSASLRAVPIHWTGDRIATERVGKDKRNGPSTGFVGGGSDNRWDFSFDGDSFDPNTSIQIADRVESRRLLRFSGTREPSRV